MNISFIITSSLVIFYEYIIYKKSTEKDKKTLFCTFFIVLISYILLGITFFSKNISLTKISFYLIESIFPSFVDFMK
ncbi:hypothetical protein SAMN05444401_2396 [Clostridium amylolyticum]|uniref:Uncharacterized protein n=1 Tax=Clostridium amylolyticum TaxID=1121298 RepID=A0A1M6H752_9CLOT|nr:hypothetical protein SAMN05444401_2396 [Clostridium amylolyticum]